MSSRATRVVVGLSGGVDSAVAAALLVEQGYEVIGLFMKNWEEDDNEQYCAAAVDLHDAQMICEHLGIELRTINFSHEYWERVFSSFLKESNAGLTPNPDVLCNREIKFKEFLAHAKSLGAGMIATGHYAGRQNIDGLNRLLRGRDDRKDQTYFLYALSQTALEQTIFPLSDLHKTEVRAKAQQLGFPVHDKKDSTGICFIGERRFKEFLSNYVDSTPGEIRNLEDQIVGSHDGLHYHTIGQRQGLGIGGAGEAWYVARKDVPNNVLYAVQGHDHPALFSNWLKAGELNWICGWPPDTPLHCTAKVRYRQSDQACVIESIDRENAHIRFSEPQRAVTPGQAVVFYNAAECLGGGTIIDCEAASVITA